MLPCLHSLNIAYRPLVSEQCVNTIHKKGKTVFKSWYRHGLNFTGDILCRGFMGRMHLRNNCNIGNNYNWNTSDPLCKAAANAHLTLKTKTPETKTPTFHSDFASLKWIYKVLPKLPWLFVQSLVGKTFCTAQ